MSAEPRLSWRRGEEARDPVKRILQGRSAESAVAMGAIDRPELLAWFEEFAGRRGVTR